MIIGIDLDGVLFDSESFYRSYAELFDIKIGGKGTKDKSQVNIIDKYNWTLKEFEQFNDECMKKITLTAPVKPYAKEVINLLKERGHKLIVFSARGGLSEWEIGATYERLKKEGLTFDKIILNLTNKVDKCKEEGVDVMIDDSFNNVNLIADKGINCLYFRELPSLPSNHENIIEIYSWGEVYRNILALEKTLSEN